jgi:hypothetical protein
VGELLQILGADQAQMMGAFLESYFRYPNSPSASVSKIRMLSQQFKSMKEKEMSIALKEIDEMSKNTNLPRMGEFVTLMIAEGQNRRGDYRQALDRLLVYFRSHPTTANFEVIEARIQKNIADVLRNEVEKGSFFEALKFNGQFANTWLKKADRLDTQYFQAKAYEQAGVFDKSESLYKSLIAKMTAPAWKKEERRRKVHEYLPSEGEVRVRLARIYKEQKKYPESLEQLKLVGPGLSDVLEVEKVQTGAAVAEASGDIKSATRYLSQLTSNWQGQPELLVSPYVKLAELYLKEKNMIEAEKSIVYVENLKNNNIKIEDSLWAKTLQLKGDHRLASGQKLAAVESYQQLLDEYETKFPLQNIRYKTGLVLFEEGDVRGAEKVWLSLNSTSGSFYKKLAQEKIDQSQWMDSYKRYIDRIPAAESMK